MNEEDICTPPRDEELNGILRRAADAIRSAPPPADAEKRAIERMICRAAALPRSPAEPDSRRSVRWLRPRGWKILWPAAAAAAALTICLIFIPSDGKSGNLLAEVFQAFDRAPAYHFVLKDLGRTGEAASPRTTETWVVRGVGRREEVRTGEKLSSIVTDNLRWLFRWDIDERLVIASPSRMAEPKKYCEIEDSELLMSRDKCLQWAERRNATIQIEKDRLEGRSVEKVVIFWPGGQVADRAVVWYDPATYRPVKIRVYSKSFAHDLVSEYEVSIDYPAPETIPANRFALEVPREARLEIGDSQLGRYIRSEGQKGPWPGP